MEFYLQGFLTLGRCEPASHEEVALRQVGEGVLRLARPACGHARIRLSSQSPDQPIRVLADRSSLERLLTNLVLNAMDAVGRQAEGEARVIVELDRSEDGRAVLRIKDPGPGPDAAVADKLFERKAA
jgi:C4-dicarboxylate-specific signal transduction histidine kinase